MARLVSSKTIKTFEKGPVRRSLFDNGAVTLFHQFPGMESACVNLYFLAGSIFESEDEEGVAHVIEHMLFKEEGSSSLVNEMERDGAEINAYTYKEYVCFELGCAADSLPKFLPKFLSLFLNPIFKEKELSLEKKVVIQELREDKDDHETEGLEYLYKQNFKRDLGHSIGGTISEVKKFEVRDLNKYYKKYYRPERMVLSICSGKAFVGLEKILSNAFPSKKAQKKKPYRLKCVRKMSKLNHVNKKLKRKMESSIIFYSFDGPSIFHSNYYAFNILDEYLLGGMSSKLFVDLREKNALVYGLGSALNSYAKEGSYMMIFHTQKKNIEKVKLKVNSALHEIAYKGISEDEVEAIKGRIARAWSLGFDDMYERSEFLAELEMLGVEDFSLKGQTHILKAVSADDIRKLAQNMIKNEFSSLTMSS